MFEQKFPVMMLSLRKVFPISIAICFEMKAKGRFILNNGVLMAIVSTIL